MPYGKVPWIPFSHWCLDHIPIKEYRINTLGIALCCCSIFLIKSATYSLFCNIKYSVDCAPGHTSLLIKIPFPLSIRRRIAKCIEEKGAWHYIPKGPDNAMTPETHSTPLSTTPAPARGPLLGACGTITKSKSFLSTVILDLLPSLLQNTSVHNNINNPSAPNIQLFYKIHNGIQTAN